MLGAWWLRTAPFYDAVPIFYLRAHIGKSVSRLVPSDAGVGLYVPDHGWGQLRGPYLNTRDEPM